MPLHPDQQARHLAAGDARQGRPCAVLRLRRGGFQDIHVLPGSRPVGYRRCDVRAAGRLHVAKLRRHRAFHRDGDICRGRRAYEPGRRGLRRLDGERRQDAVLREFPGPVAVPDGGTLHWRHDGIPDGLAGLWENQIKPWWSKRQLDRRTIRERVAAAHAVIPDSSHQPPQAPGYAPLPDDFTAQRA